MNSADHAVLALSLDPDLPDGFAITTVDLDVNGRVPGLDAHRFEQAAERAAQLCPVSKALKGNVDIRLIARLEP